MSQFDTVFKLPAPPNIHDLLRSDPEPSAWVALHEGVFLAPLEDLSLQVRFMRFVDGSFLSQATRSDRRLFREEKPRRDLYWPPTWQTRQALADDQCLFRVKATGHDFDTAADQAREKVARLVTAFRLLNGDSPAPTTGIAMQPGIASSKRSFSPSYPVDSLGFAFSYGRVTVNRKIARQIRLIYKHLGQMPAKGQLAVGRFNRVRTRESDQDRIIDLWIAFEALFSPPASGENTFRMALRIAHFVAAPPDRNDVYRTLLDSYDLRSEVVHGRQWKPQSSKLKLDPQSVIAMTADYLRKALCRIALQNPQFDSTQLDEAIVRGTAR